MLLLKVTVPEGVTGVPTSASVTVAVHHVGAFTGTEAGLQMRLVDVVRLVAATVKLAPLDIWSVSPR